MQYRAVESIAEEVREAYAKGKTKFIFHNPAETVLMHTLRKTQAVVNVCTEIPASNFFMHVSGIDGEESYNKWCDENGMARRMNILVSHNFEWAQKMFYGKIAYLELPYNVKIKEKKFVCFNKIERLQRIKLLCRMLHSKLIDKGYYSFAGSRPDWNSYYTTNAICHFNEEINDTLIRNEHRFPLVCNITPDRENPIDLLPEDILYHDNSYFSIVTETLFYRREEYGFKRSLFDYLNGRFLTEKTYRPISLKHPFILFAMNGSLDLLRDAGYKTFHPYIDETYDTISDADERFEVLWLEINRLCKFTDEQWLEWQENIKPIVEHNYNNLMGKTRYSIKPIEHLFKD